jgi:hypothetical protein
VIDVHGAASRSAPCLHVSPAITNHETAAQVEPEIMCGIEQKTRSWLPASASVGIVVKADVHGRYLDLLTQFPVDLMDDLGSLQPPRDVRLIRHHHEGVSGCLQPKE